MEDNRVTFELKLTRQLYYIEIKCNVYGLWTLFYTKINPSTQEDTKCFGKVGKEIPDLINDFYNWIEAEYRYETKV